MKLNKTVLKKLIERELNNILSEQMAGMGGGGSVVETSRTIMAKAVTALEEENPNLAKELNALMDQLMEDGHI